MVKTALHNATFWDEVKFNIIPTLNADSKSGSSENEYFFHVVTKGKVGLHSIPHVNFVALRVWDILPLR